MPNWKKVIVSGSDAALNSLSVTNGITGSLLGTASFALTSSFINPLNQNVTLVGNQTITGSLTVSSSNATQLQVGSNLLFVSGSGRVGIGTSDPSYALHISGSGVGFASNRFIAGGAFASAGDPEISTRSTIAGLFEPAYANLGFSSFGGEAGRIEGASRLWNIGMTGGTARFNIRGTGATSSTTALRVENSNFSASLVVLDNGQMSQLSSAETISTWTHTNGNYVDLRLGNGSALAAGQFGYYWNNTSVLAYLNGGVWRVGTPSTSVLVAGAAGIPLQLRGTSPSGPTNLSGTATGVIITNNGGNTGPITSGSGTLNIANIGYFNTNDTWAMASGNATLNVLTVQHRYNTTGSYSGTIRGIYYDPIILSLSGSTHRAIETTSGDVLFQSGSTSLFFVSGSGNVGIGTTSPTSRLHISSSNNNDGLTIHYPATNSTQFPFYIGTSGTDPYVRINASNFEFFRQGNPSTIRTAGSNNDLVLEGSRNIIFNSNGANERVRVTSAGDVGIGTTSPSARVQVRGSGATSSTTALRVENSNASASLVVLDNGNTGIRQSSPTYGLDIAGTTTLADNIIRIQPGSNAMSPQFIIDDGSERRLALGTNSGGGIFSSGNLNYAAVLGSPAGYDIQFFTVNTARMTILAANGNVGIGTATPTARLQVNDNSGIVYVGAPTTSYGGIGFDTTFTTNNAALFGIAGSTQINVRPGGSIISRIGNDATVGELNQTTSKLTYINGNVGIGTTNPSASLHISGTSATALFEIDSPALNNIIFVSGSGRVGIGTGTPGYPLDINGNNFISLRTSTPFQVESGNNNYRIANLIGNSGYHAGLGTNNTYDIFSVGANPTSSGAGNTAGFFRVNLAGGNSTGYYGAAGSNNSLVQLNATTTSTIIASAQNNGIAMIGGTGGGQAVLTTIAAGTNLNLRSDNNGSFAGGGINYLSSINGSNHSHRWYHNNSEQMRLSFGGNLLVGTTSELARVQVRGSGATSSTTALLVENSNASASLVVLDNGNVGIGLSNPFYNLDVVGTIHMNNVNDPFGGLRIDKSGNNSRLIVRETGALIFGTNDVEVARFDAGGNFGIGLTSPVARLHVSGAASSVLLIASSSAGPALFVSGSGRVGINTTTPRQQLEVNGAILSRTAEPLFIMEDTSNVDNNAFYMGAFFDTGFPISYGSLAINRNPANGVFFNTARAASQINFESSASFSMVRFYTANTNNTNPDLAVSITPLRNMIVGSSAVGNEASARLHVRGSGTTSATNTVRIENSGATASLLIRDDNQTSINGNTSITGSFTVITGSNVELEVLGTGVRLGNIVGDAHTITGSLGVSGSTTFNGNITATIGGNTEFQVLNTGVRLGNVIGDVHTATGSFGVSGSLTATSVTSSGALVSLANNAMYLRGGDDAEFWDINVSNTVGIRGQQNADRAGITLGSSGPTIFGTGNNIGLGTTSPSERLHIVAAGTTTDVPLLIRGTGTKGGAGYLDFLYADNTGGGSNPKKYFRINSAGDLEIVDDAYGTTIFSLEDSGNLTIAGTLTQLSDISLKTNIQTIPNALEKTLQLRGVEYNRISTNKHELGLIAQEVEQVLPELVNETNGIKSVAYSNIVSILIESIKELKQEIDTLREQINKK